jgi:hypothetical protein
MRKNGVPPLDNADGQSRRVTSEIGSARQQRFGPTATEFEFVPVCRSIFGD